MGYTTEASLIDSIGYLRYKEDKEAAMYIEEHVMHVLTSVEAMIRM